MRLFHRIAWGVDVLPLLHAVKRQPELWNVNNLRTTHPGTVHGKVDDIWLRFNDLAAFENTREAAQVLDQHESINYPAFHALPQARPIIFDLMRRVEGERLGRVLITRLAPGCRIAPHEDGGDYAAYYDRYQVALQGLPGSVFRVGDEQVFMQSGDVWWFKNVITHEVVNNSAADRIHMVVDIRTSR